MIRKIIVERFNKEKTKSPDPDKDPPPSPSEKVHSVRSNLNLEEFDSSSYFLEDSTDPQKYYDAPIKYFERNSLFTSYSQTGGGYEGKFSLWGLSNLCFMILFVSLFRLVYQNFIKYGLLYESYLNFFYNLLSLNFSELPILVVMLIYMIIPITAAYLIERYFSRVKWIGEKLLFVLNFANVIIFFILMTISLLKLDIYPFWTFVFVIIFLIVWFKLISYYHVNYLFRSKVYESEIYPNNISYLNMWYFIFVPTLVYTDNFPRTKSIRWRQIFLWLVEGIFALALFSFILSQYIIPLIDNAMPSIDGKNFGDVLDRIIRLTIPGIILYCLIFYVVFHCLFNISAELLMFGDRSFYSNWWDATSFDQFWRRWNLPVHRYCLYHIYFPLIRSGWCSKSTANIVVFGISAIFHEYLLAVPFKNIKFVGFLSMIIEVPVLVLTKRFTKGRVIGNFIFWLSWMFGFSNIIMLYYFDYHHEHKI